MTRAEKTKVCKGDCGRRLPLSDYHRDRRNSTGRKSRCKQCVADYDKMSREAGMREASDEDRRRDRIRWACKDAIYKGELIPRPCENCGALKVQAHHEVYSEDRALDVMWLCVVCHRAIHSPEGMTKAMFPIPTEDGPNQWDAIPFED